MPSIKGQIAVRSSLAWRGDLSVARPQCTCIKREGLYFLSKTRTESWGLTRLVVSRNQDSLTTTIQVGVVAGLLKQNEHASATVDNSLVCDTEDNGKLHNPPSSSSHALLLLCIVLTIVEPLPETLLFLKRVHPLSLGLVPSRSSIYLQQQ